MKNYNRNINTENFNITRVNNLGNQQNLTNQKKKLKH